MPPQSSEDCWQVIFLLMSDMLGSTATGRKGEFLLQLGVFSASENSCSTLSDH